MCATCGCSTPARPGAREDHHDHHHPPEHAHDGLDHRPPDPAHAKPSPASTARRLVELERDVLAHNARLAERNRGWLAGRGVLALNLMSSPGAGKTSLLERTIRDLAGTLAIGVIEGDQATERDADRIRAAGARAIQVNTGAMCHLDAAMVGRALAELDPPPASAVAIENVGNLVCPALFDLGEHARVVVVSVTEGDDKPLKYPHMFRAANLLVLNKIDLLPHVEFDVARCAARARELNPRLARVEVSATTGHGLEAWYEWLLAAATARRHPLAAC